MIETLLVITGIIALNVVIINIIQGGDINSWCVHNKIVG